MIKRIKAVELLIERHREKAGFLAQMAEKHLQTAKDLEQYKYELQRPGFKTKGWHRYSAKGRTEPYVVQGEIE